MVPGLALLDALVEIDQAPEELLWFQSGRAVEERVLTGLEERLPTTRVQRTTLQLEPVGGGAPSPGRTLLRLPPEVLRARRALRQGRVQVLVGLGGFASAPAGVAARLLGVPLVLLEINATPGKATRLLGSLARHVVHATEETRPPSPGERHLLLGAPVSPRFQRRRGVDADARRHLGIDPARPLLVVLGGSQGAGGLNRFVREGAARLSREGIQVVHQVGPGRLSEGSSETDGYRAVEYARDVPALLAAADLVLCRGGASTLAEVAEVGVPTWVVPYPHHADRHQERNAAALGEGTRVVQEEALDSARLEELVALLGPQGKPVREAMEAALVHGKPSGAARKLAELVLRLAMGRP